MKRKLLVLISLITVLCMFFSGCTKSAGKTSVNVQDKDTVTCIPSPGEPTSLDPHKANQASCLKIVRNISETLINYDEKSGEFKPAAAEKWEISKDGKEYTFYLAEGNKFTNGMELTAKDVKYSLVRASSSSFASGYFTALDKVNVVDDYTVKLKLKYAYSPFLNYLTLPVASILCESYVKEKGDEYSRNPIGTGPYKLSEWKSGEYIKLVANEDYHLEKAKIKNVVLKYIGDKTSQAMALKKGDVDMVFEISFSEKENLINDENFTYFEVLAAFADYIPMNMENKYLKDIKVRQAIAMCIDYEGALLAYFDGNGDVLESMILPAVFGCDKSIKRYEQNFDKAKELLAEAGYTDGFEISIDVYDENSARCAQVIQANLRKIGINLSINQLEGGAFLERQANGTYEMCINGFEFYVPDADSGLYPLLHSDNIETTLNVARYNNPEIDKLLDDARVEVDREKRKEMYFEISRITHEELPYIPLDVPYMGIAHNVKLKGVSASSMGDLYFSEWYWE